MLPLNKPKNTLTRSDMPVMQQIIGLCLCLLLCFGVAAIGASASITTQTFYLSLEQPTWAPPAWLFGPVWSVLFLLMAVSVFLVWRLGGIQRNILALGIFICQLAANALWSWLFFAWQLGSIAFFELLLLWFFIGLNIYLFWRVNPLAALLLLPYWLWVSFAGILNFSLWQLNIAVLG